MVWDPYYELEFQEDSDEKKPWLNAINTVSMVYAFLKHQYDQGISVVRYSDILKNIPRCSKTVQYALRKLEHSGLVRKESRGKYYLAEHKARVISWEELQELQDPKELKESRHGLQKRVCMFCGSKWTFEEFLRIHEQAHEKDVFPIPKKYNSFARVILLRAIGEEPSLLDIVDERLRRAEEAELLAHSYVREAISHLDSTEETKHD